MSAQGRRVHAPRGSRRGPTRRTGPGVGRPPSAHWAIAALGLLAGAFALAGSVGWPRLELVALCLLPAALAHAALTLPQPSPLARRVPGLVAAGYLLCAVPAALGARAGNRQQALAGVAAGLAIALASGAGVALAMRLRHAVRSGRRLPALVAMAGLAALEAGILGVVPRTFRWASALVLPLGLWGSIAREREARAPVRARPAGDPAGLSFEQVARGMAHTTLKPVTAVAQRLSTLSQEARDPALRGELAAAAALMEQVRRLVRDVLDLARSGAGPNRRPVDLARVIEQAVSDVGLRYPEATVRARGEAPTACVDSIAIRSMLVNVLENAVEAGGEQSEVRVELCDDGAGGAVIRVIDQGPGIPPGDRERVFQAFETRKPLGTGLGLTVAREICRAHGGELVVCSSDSGTVLEARLPG